MNVAWPPRQCFSISVLNVKPFLVISLDRTSTYKPNTLDCQDRLSVIDIFLAYLCGDASLQVLLELGLLLIVFTYSRILCIVFLKY